LRNDNAMDGVPGVTQDPVKPGENFIYRLKLEEAGTFWYHPHFNSSEQLERGLKGVFIVEETDKLPWSRDWWAPGKVSPSVSCLNIPGSG